MRNSQVKLVAVLLVALVCLLGVVAMLENPASTPPTTTEPSTSVTTTPPTTTAPPQTTVPTTPPTTLRSTCLFLAGNFQAGHRLYHSAVSLS